MRQRLHNYLVRRWHTVVYYIDARRETQEDKAPLWLSAVLRLKSHLPVCVALVILLTAGIAVRAADYHAANTDAATSVSCGDLLSGSDAQESLSETDAAQAYAQLPLSDESDEIALEDYEVQLGAPKNCRLDKPQIEKEMLTTFSQPLKSARVTSLFGYRTNPVSGKYTFHTGYDLAAASGQDIYAMFPGKVITAASESGYGNYVVIDHGNGLRTLYAHCSKLLVKKGQQVDAGSRIALVGSTGNSTGPHLHVEIRIDSVRYDPEWLLGGIYQ